MTKIHDVGGVKVALSEIDGFQLSKFLSTMSVVPDLKSMIKTDDNGLIVSFEPKNISWGFVFFIQNLMIMQRMNIMDDFMRKEGLIL